MAKIQKLTTKQFYEMVRTESLKVKNQLIKEEKEAAFEKVGDPLEIKLNTNDKLGDSTKALVFKDAKSKEEKSSGPKTEKSEPFTEKEGEALDIKTEKEGEEGSDKKAASAVEVKAGAEKGGKDSLTGQHKANFTSKSENPKKEVSAPFDEKASDKMNVMDKESKDKTPLTYVTAGAEEGGNKVTAGLHKKDIKTAAPKSEEKSERIAKGIEIKENYSKKDLQEFIMNEAKKLAKKQMLEEELNKLNKELGLL